MKVPTDRAKFMDELRTNLEDATGFAFERCYLGKRNISELVGHEAYVEYTEETAPQLLNVKYYGSDKIVKIEFCRQTDCLDFYVDGKFYNTMDFDSYKSKLTFTAAVAVRLAHYLY